MMGEYDLPERALEPKEGRVPLCPVCGEECHTVYRGIYGEYVGCDGCLEALDTWDADD